MNFSQATKIVNHISLRTKARSLTDAETIALRAAWDSIGYEKAISKSKAEYSESYVRSDAGRKLWIMLSDNFGTKINKSSLRLYFDSHPELLAKEKSNSKILGGYPPVIANLIGRQKEIEELQHLSTTVQFVCIHGMAGIGKTCLAAKAISEIHQQSSQLDYYVWLPVHYKPSISELLDCLMGYLGGGTGNAYQKNRTSGFIQFLQRHRCLIVLDEIDLMVSSESGQVDNEYQVFFRRLIEEQHQSCLWTTSSIYMEELSRYKNMGFPCEIMQLSELTAKEVKQVVESHGITFDEDWEEMVSSCMGNPLLLHSVLKKVSHLLGGQAGLVNQKTSLALNEFEYMLDKIFVNSPDIKDLEMLVLCQIATVGKKKDSVNLIGLTQSIAEKQSNISELEVLNSVERLQKHNLLSLQTGKKSTIVTMGNLIRKYILRNFVEKAENISPGP